MGAQSKVEGCPLHHRHMLPTGALLGVFGFCRWADGWVAGWGCLLRLSFDTANVYVYVYVCMCKPHC